VLVDDVDRSSVGSVDAHQGGGTLVEHVGEPLVAADLVDDRRDEFFS